MWAGGMGGRDPRFTPFNKCVCVLLRTVKRAGGISEISQVAGTA